MSVATIPQTDPKADAIGRRAFKGLPPSARQRQQQCLCTNSAHASLVVDTPLPVFPRERTSSGRPGTSEKCQRATSTRSRSVRSGGRDRKLKESTASVTHHHPAGVSIEADVIRVFTEFDRTHRPEVFGAEERD